MRRNRRLAVGLLLLATLIVVVYRPPRHTLTERAHILCEDCGLTVAETDRLIDTMRYAEGDRAALLSDFYGTFDDGGDPEPCRPCAEAILDAAHR